MSINLLNLLNKQVTGSLAKEASGFLHESESGITSALSSFFPSLLGSAMRLGASNNGATQMMDMMTSMDDGFMDNIEGIFSSGTDSVSKFSGVGTSIVKMLLGNKMDGLLDMVMDGSGLKKSSASSLLSMAAPFLIGMIKRQVMNKGVSGLMGLLSSQKDFVKGALPSKYGNILGLSDMFGSSKAVTNLTSSTKNVASNVATATLNTGKKASGSIMKWLIPSLLLLLVLGYFGMKTSCSTIDKAANKVTNATENVVDGTTDMAKHSTTIAGNTAEVVVDAGKTVAGGIANIASNAFGKVNDIAKSSLDKVTFSTGSAGDQMMKFIDEGFKGDGHFKFNNMKFKTGKATISKEAGIEVDKIAAIMAAYPNLKIQIEGHTDNTGRSQSNKLLSQMRADAVKARLSVRGITGERVSALGYGSEKPTDSNETVEGRTANRRIEVVLVK